MKKIIVIVSVCLLLFSGCVFESSKSNQNHIDLNAILEVDSEQLNDEIELNHKNVINTKGQAFVADNAKKEMQLTLGNVKHELGYVESIYYPLRGEALLRYIVDGNEENSIFLKENGDIVAIPYGYTKLNIKPTATPTEILEPLKAELSKVFDIAYYENVRMSKPYDGNYWVYDYLFYNECSGYLTDTLLVSVTNDGMVIGLKTFSLAAKDFEINVDKEKEQSAIEQKMKDLYNTDSTQYRSHKVMFDPCVVQYNDQVYIQYDIAAKYFHTEFGEMSGYIEKILIPLNDISN